VVSGSQIKFTTDGSDYGTAPFNGFDVQDLNTGTTITGITLDTGSAAFPIAQLTLGADDVAINLAAPTPFVTTGTVILDVTTTPSTTIPEPPTWTIMIAGLIGVAARKHLLGSQAA
jgi:hypothetical protein